VIGFAFLPLKLVEPSIVTTWCTAGTIVTRARLLSDRSAERGSLG